MAQFKSAAALMLTIIVLLVVMMTGVYVTSTITGLQGPYESEDTVLLQGTGNWVDIQNDVLGESETVRDSNGYGLQLAGTDDSYAETTSNIDFATDDNWTVAAVGNADTATKNMTLISVNGRLTISHNASDSVWRAWYFDDGTTNSYTVNVSAPSPTDTTTLIAYSNGTHLTLERDDVESNTTQITASNIETASINTTNWDGWVDEFRTADREWNSTQRSNWHTYPVTPVLDADHTSRVMFDEPDRDRQRVFYSNSEMNTFNASFVAGVSGSIMDADRNTLVNPDYEWEFQGPRIKPLAGGRLDQAPVAYVDYEANSRIQFPLDGINSFFKFAALLPVVILTAFIIARIQDIKR